VRYRVRAFGGILALSLAAGACGGVTHEQGSNSGNASNGGLGGFGGLGGMISGGAGVEQMAEAGAGSTKCDPTQGRVCSGDLSNIGTGSFEVDFQLTTSATALSALLSQRGICTHAYFWDTRLVDGKIVVELDDLNQHYAPCMGSTNVNDGVPHQIEIRRVAGKLQLYIDCALDVECDSAADLNMPLPAVQVGTSVCGTTDGTSALVGTLSGVCIGTR
jgi:hypothetical protein